MKEARGTCGDLFGVLFGSPTHLLISYEVMAFFSLSFFRCCKAEHSCGWHLQYFLVYLGGQWKEARPSLLHRRSLFPGGNEILNHSENSGLLCPKFDFLELEKVVLNKSDHKSAILCCNSWALFTQQEEEKPLSSLKCEGIGKTVKQRHIGKSFSKFLDLKNSNRGE